MNVYATPFRIERVRFERGQIGWTALIGYYVTTADQFTDIFMETGRSSLGNGWLTPIMAFQKALRAARSSHKDCSATPDQRIAKGWA